MGALGDAARQGRTDEVSRLLAKPCIDVNITKPDGERWTALMNAASRGHTKAVRALLKHPKIKVKQTNENGVTALMVAAIYGQTEAVRALLEDEKRKGFPHDEGRGQYFDMKDNRGRTACDCAEEYGHTDIMNILVEAMISSTSIHEARFIYSRPSYSSYYSGSSYSSWGSSKSGSSKSVSRAAKSRDYGAHKTLK